MVIQNPETDERGQINRAIQQLKDWGVLTGAGTCDDAALEKLRELVRRNFKIPWTSITPAMERLLYTIVSVNRPANIVAVGIFCGNTLIWNIGPACGPDRGYKAERLVGIELDPQRADMARDNLRKIGILDSVEVIAGDGHEVLKKIDYPIHHLYLDYGCPYKPMLEAGMDKLADGALVIAHNTIHRGWVKQESSQAYLAFVRDKSVFRESVSIEPDALGIEVTLK